MPRAHGRRLRGSRRPPRGRDVAAAQSLYLDACDAGFAPGCRYAAGGFLRGDRPRAYSYLRRACSLGDAIACNRTFGRKGSYIYIDKPLLLAGQGR